LSITQRLDKRGRFDIGSNLRFKHTPCRKKIVKRSVEMIRAPAEAAANIKNAVWKKTREQTLWT